MLPEMSSNTPTYEYMPKMRASKERKVSDAYPKESLLLIMRLPATIQQKKSKNKARNEENNQKTSGKD